MIMTNGRWISFLSMCVRAFIFFSLDKTNSMDTINFEDEVIFEYIFLLWIWVRGLHQNRHFFCSRSFLQFLFAFVAHLARCRLFFVDY